MESDLGCVADVPEAMPFFRRVYQFVIARRLIDARWACAMLVVCITSIVVLLHWHHRLQSLGGAHPEMVFLAESDSNAWTFIRWAKHPTKCLDVGGTSSGARLQIWACHEQHSQNQRFIVPPDGTTGEIRWAINPELCLDTPRHGDLQMWTCAETPKENRRWMISPDGKGRIHLAADPSKCLDIPDEVQDNGWKTQIWDCDDTSRRGRAQDVAFITHAVDCTLGAWSSWSACSVTCGGGSHIRSRKVVMKASTGGKSCRDIDHMESGRCGVQQCRGHTEKGIKSGGMSSATTSLNPAYKYITSSQQKVVEPAPPDDRVTQQLTASCQGKLTFLTCHAAEQG